MHFANPLWLWMSIAMPLLWIAYFLFLRKEDSQKQLEKHIDAHLLPYLIVSTPYKKNTYWKSLLLWTIVWSCLTLALAGPRWSFKEIETFSHDQSLVILLDLSESMNATDIKPSRLIRAKQKIEDLLNLSVGMKIGLIAFAADSHMITPLTDDKETVRHLLSSLDTELVYVQGSRLTPALDMAANMLEAEPGNNKAILIISDGGFEDSSAIMTARNLFKKNIIVHTMGMGSKEGIQFTVKHAAKKGSLIFSKLESERLKEISHVCKGCYSEGQDSDIEIIKVLDDLKNRSETQKNIGQKKQLWDEYFYFMILPALPIVLLWFRRGALFSILLFFSIFTMPLSASVEEYFLNTEEAGKKAFDKEDFTSAVETFQDPYRKGVACYKANNFADAEKYFAVSARSDVACQAAYNLGNSQVQQQKYKEAIKTYEELLIKYPDHTNAKENLELVKKMLEQQQQQDDSNSENSDQKDDSKDKDSKDKKKDSKNSKDSKDKDKNSQDQQNNQQDQNDQDSEKNENPQDSEDSQEPEKDESSDNEDADADDSNSEEENQQNAQQNKEEQSSVEADQKDTKEAKALKSEEDQDADRWLNLIDNDQKTFMKNKFYIESKKNGTKEGFDPW